MVFPSLSGNKRQLQWLMVTNVHVSFVHHFQKKEIITYRSQIRNANDYSYAVTINVAGRNALFDNV